MSPSPFSLDGKVALITGASRGIGAAIARRFAEHGAQLVLASRKQEGVDAVADPINHAGGEALAKACHVGKEDQLQALVAAAIARFGRIDVLVNNAGTNPYFGPMLGTPWPAFDKTFEVNLKGYFALTRMVVEHLTERGARGSIINIASILGTTSAAFQGVYGMTKASVISMTQTLARELGPSGIRVNAICPGLVQTRLAQALVDSEPIRAGVEARTPLGRIGEPDDISGAAVYLASDASAYVTGHALVIDGGLTLLGIAT